MLEAVITKTMRITTKEGPKRFSPGHVVDGETARFAIDNGYGSEQQVRKKPAPQNKAKQSPNNK